MIRIQRRFIEKLRASSSGQDLIELVEGAIRLEHSTIPPYLTAMLSLQPETNREIWGIIHSVVTDEMLHMTIGCNLLNAFGKSPEIDSPGFVPDYPGPLPMGIDKDLVVGLEPFSTDLAKYVFMKIEEPEKPIVFRSLESAQMDYATIGQFYRVLIDKIRELGEGQKPLFVGDPRHQVAAKNWFSSDRLFAITDVQSATQALELVIEEGEGTTVSPLAKCGELAHYYRFEEIARLQHLVRDPKAPNGYSFSGTLPFDPTTVYPLTKNQKVADLDASSEGGRRARQFSFVYTKLLKGLQRTFSGEPDYFDTALALMYELKLAGQILCSLPAVKNNSPTGLNVGPTFEYVTAND
jgi:Ferritin-like